MSLFTYIKYPIDPSNWDERWYYLLPATIIDRWATHKDILHIGHDTDQLSSAERTKRVNNIQKHNLELLKKIILEWEDD